MRFEGAGYGVGGIGGSAVVLRGADAAFGVGLDDEAGEVGDGVVDFVDFVRHQLDGGVDGVEGGEMADDLRAGKIDGEGHADAPGTELVGDAGELVDHLGFEGAEVGVYVVDGDAVDPDGGQKAAVVVDAGEVGADVAVVEEDAAAGVAALDGAVEVVPLVDPADGGGGGFGGGFGGEWMLRGDQLEEMEGAVEFTARVDSENYVTTGVTFYFLAEGVGVGSGVCRR